MSQNNLIICNPEGKLIESGKCIIYNEKRDSIGAVNIGSNGSIVLPDSKINYIEIESSGYAPKLLKISSLPSDTVFLQPAVSLDEVVITPDKVKELGNHTSYRLSMEDMDRDTNLFQALNLIPHLTILPTGGYYYEGNSNILFLINGVEASTSELKSISKEDIANVDVYKNPSARFVSRNISTVIDIRLKSNITGGNAALNINQAFYPLKGYNSAAFFYNYKRSRFSVQYNGENRHYKKARFHDNLRYEFDGVTYEKNKRGEDSKTDNDNNNLNLSFQNNKTQSYLYNVQVGIGWDREKQDMHQTVTTNSDKFDAINFLKTNFTKYNIANYFEKQIGENTKYGTIYANVNYQHFDTRYISSYEEFAPDNVQNLVRSHSAYKTRLDGIFSEIQYVFPETKVGYFSISAYDSYKHSKYIDSTSPIYQTTNYAGATASWFGYWKTFQWDMSMGMSYDYISTSSMDKSDSNIVPDPRIRLIWRPLKNLRIQLAYSYSVSNPSIAQLSETNQWLDTKLVYHGNSTLHAGKENELSLLSSYSNKYIQASLRLIYRNSPDRICSQYLLTDKYMLETIVNLDSYNEYSGMLDLNILPLGNDKLTFWNRIILAKVNGKNSQYSWNGNRFQWMSVLSLNLKKWTVSAFYQYPGKGYDGQLILPRAECWSISGYYRPINNLSVGLTWFMPFGKTFSDSQYTIPTAPVYSDRIYDIRDGANYVSLEVSWNFSFGRNKNKARPRFGNGDNDSGILKK